MMTIVIGLTKMQRRQLEEILRKVPAVPDQRPDVGQLISFDVCAIGTLERCFEDEEEK